MQTSFGRNIVLLQLAVQGRPADHEGLGGAFDVSLENAQHLGMYDHNLDSVNVCVIHSNHQLYVPIRSQQTGCYNAI